MAVANIADKKTDKPKRVKKEKTLSQVLTKKLRDAMEDHETLVEVGQRKADAEVNVLAKVASGVYSVVVRKIK